MESPKPALSDLPSGLRHRRSIGLSGMRGNSHVPFLGDGGWRQAPATRPSAALPLPVAADAQHSASVLNIMRRRAVCLITPKNSIDGCSLW